MLEKINERQRDKIHEFASQFLHKHRLFFADGTLVRVLRGREVINFVYSGMFNSCAPNHSIWLANHTKR